MVTNSARIRMILLFGSILCALVAYSISDNSLRAETKLTGRELSKDLTQIADEYVRTMRKWEPGTYKLQVRGKPNEYYLVIGYLLKDYEEAKRFFEENPGVGKTMTYPSEFMLYIDYDKREVVLDVRPGQKERHPRP